MNRSCGQNVEKLDIQCVYYMHNIPLFVMDMVRIFQDHPVYKNGIKQDHIVDMLKQQKFADGDLTAQVESAVRTLEASGYLLTIGDGYRTLGPLSKLAKATTPKQRNAIYVKIKEKF